MARKVLMVANDLFCLGTYDFCVEELNREYEMTRTVTDAIQKIDSGEFMGTFIRGLGIELGRDYETILNPEEEYEPDAMLSGGMKIVRHSVEKGLRTLFLPINENLETIYDVKKLGADVFPAFDPDMNSMIKIFQAVFSPVPKA